MDRQVMETTYQSKISALINHGSRMRPGEIFQWHRHIQRRCVMKVKVLTVKRMANSWG